MIFLKRLAKGYNIYETNELARRRAKKRTLNAYKNLKKKKRKPLKSRKFNPKAYTKAIGNPYKL